MKWLFLSIAIIGEIVGTSALKSAEGFTRLLPTLITIAGYTLSFFFLSLALKEIPVGIAYAIWAGTGIVLISLIGVLFYKQSLDAPAIVGIALILFGVLIINIFSKSVSH